MKTRIAFTAALLASGAAWSAEAPANTALHALFEREFQLGLKELGYDAQFSQWTGLFAPAGTPEPVIAKLREAARAAVADPVFQSSLAKLETPIQYLDAPQFKAFWDRDAQKLADAVKRIGKVE